MKKWMIPKMIDLHFLEFAMGNKLSPDQIKEVLSAMRLKGIVEKWSDSDDFDLSPVANDFLRESEE